MVVESHTALTAVRLNGVASEPQVFVKTSHLAQNLAYLTDALKVTALTAERRLEVTFR